jgi:hypothetical protein
MEAILDLCLPCPSAVGRSVRAEGNAFSLSSSNVSLPLSLSYNIDVIFFFRKGFVASEQLKFMCFTVLFSILYKMTFFLQLL